MSEAILISKRDAAKALSISLRTLDNLIASKELAVRRVGRRCLIPRRALEDFARRDHATEPVNVAEVAKANILAPAGEEQ